MYFDICSCWLDSDPTKAAIWTFVVPMLLVILVSNMVCVQVYDFIFSILQINSVILVLTVISIVRGKKRGGAETEVKIRTLVM